MYLKPLMTELLKRILDANKRVQVWKLSIYTLQFFPAETDTKDQQILSCEKFPTVVAGSNCIFMHLYNYSYDNTPYMIFCQRGTGQISVQNPSRIFSLYLNNEHQ